MSTETIKNTDNQKNREWIPNRVAILGAGRSGSAVARYLTERGVTVFISETCGKEKLGLLLASNNLADVSNEADGHTKRILGYDLIICSPGIRSDLPILNKARDKHIPVWAEIELGYRQSKAPFLAVTGSTGKSTTVSLLGAILTAAGKDNVVAGNIGLPLISAAPKVSEDGFVVAEISSFQLEIIDQFRPKVAAVLNFMKNHLDRYDSEDDYYDAKKAIIHNMKSDDILVLNAKDPLLMKWAEHLESLTIMYYGEDVSGYDSIFYNESKIFIRMNGVIETLTHEDTLQIAGQHNIENACAAIAIAYCAGIEKELIIEGLRSFKGLPHRLEYIREIHSVKYYNDSKATTAESIECAVNAFSGNVHLIAGGRDKGCDFEAIRESIRKNVKSVCLIGEAASRINKEWKGLTVINHSETLGDAVKQVSEDAVEGDVVILSPGCSSFDMFTSFENRGDIFRDLVNDLS